MPTCQVRAIEIKLCAAECLSVIIWRRESREVFLNLINSKRTWWAARRGDAVLLKGKDFAELDRYFQTMEDR